VITRRLHIKPERFAVRVAAAVGAMMLMGLNAPSFARAHHEEVDPERSTITVRVFKTGLFRAFADNHEVRAPIQTGFVDAGSNAGVQIVVEAQQMRVLDPDLSMRDRDQVQARMLGPDVLDAARFPEIRFESTTVTETRPDEWTVQGRLTLHGETRPWTVEVVRNGDHYKGSSTLKQTSFGITPISVAGGTVKVKDEVAIEFDVVTRVGRPGDRGRTARSK
jgi:hypothetical protein